MTLKRKILFLLEVAGGSAACIFLLTLLFPLPRLLLALGVWTVLALLVAPLVGFSIRIAGQPQPDQRPLRGFEV